MIKKKHLSQGGTYEQDFGWVSDHPNFLRVHSLDALLVWGSDGDRALQIAHLGVLSEISESVRFARRRFGHYDLIDFAVVLIGYAISSEHTLEAFYERLQPFAAPFMALFGRGRLPHRSTLSRFLAALDQTPVEALRTLFLEDLLARPLEKVEKTGGLWDRQGTHWLVFDVDGTRQAARQRALPCTPDLPPAQRRLDEVCAPGYTGRKRGETVRTRTTMRKNHTHQWVGTFSGALGAGNGGDLGELRQAVKAISTYMHAQSVPLSQAVIRLDGQYGNGAIVADLAGLAYVIRGKDYDLLDLPQVQARLARSPDQQTTHPETGTCRALFDFPDLSLSPTGLRTRVIVAARLVTDSPVKVGTRRGEHVYELFYTALPPGAFTPADVVALYLHRSAFEAVLSDEDQEQAPDRWCSHTAWGQEFWLILAQWIWNEAPGTGPCPSFHTHAHHRIRTDLHRTCGKTWRCHPNSHFLSATGVGRLAQGMHCG